jgi:hypothetical protein
MHVHLAHIGGAGIAITLRNKSLRSTAITRLLRAKSGCRYDGGSRHAYSCQGQEQD